MRSVRCLLPGLQFKLVTGNAPSGTCEKIDFRKVGEFARRKTSRLNAVQTIFGVRVYIFDPLENSKKLGESIFSQLPVPEFCPVRAGSLEKIRPHGRCYTRTKEFGA